MLAASAQQVVQLKPKKWIKTTFPLKSLMEYDVPSNASRAKSGAASPFLRICAWTASGATRHRAKTRLHNRGIKVFIETDPIDVGRTRAI